MATQTGPLVLADISGYTAFVADTELEHSREILNELLETLVRGLARHLRIGQIEGDAVFALGPTLPEEPGAWLEDCFVRFHRHLNAIKRVTTCPCRACANVGILTLKFVCHYGEYLPQSFLGKETFVGNAVNQVHRLLKNKVPSREYLLMIMEAKRPAQLTMAMQFGDALAWNTVRLKELPDGRTKLVSRYRFDRPGGTLTQEERAMGRTMMDEYEHEAAELIAREVERGAEAVAPA